MAIKNISLLGSTGSIGTQTLEVVKQHKTFLTIKGLAAGRNLELLKKQIKEFNPEAVSLQDKNQALAIQKEYKNLTVYHGDEGNLKLAALENVDIVVIATPGLPGLRASLEAIKNKKTIALATKEVLVSAGEIVMKESLQNKVSMLPIDSEHSAIFQCLERRTVDEISQIILTCSGGPFRGKKLSDLKHVTPAQALAHPSWNMGKKITIDSATLMNKGFEVLEAHWLFGIPLNKIKVVVHPQSAIHSAVEFVDGVILAQMGPSDMRLPIQYALLYPGKRKKNNFKRFSFSDYPTLSFEEPDLKTFPCLSLAYEAGRKGGTYPTVLTATNDIAVEAFLKEQIPFLSISKILEQTLSRHATKSHPTIEEIYAADLWARTLAKKIIEKR